MKIDLENNWLKPFDRLGFGDVFKIGGDFYIKIYPINDFTAINLRNGDKIKISDNRDVLCYHKALFKPNG